jgi:hypothetical protein
MEKSTVLKLRTIPFFLFRIYILLTIPERVLGFLDVDTCGRKYGQVFGSGPEYLSRWTVALVSLVKPTVLPKYSSST